MRGCELDHLSCTDHQHLLVGEAGKYPPGELDRRGRHRNNVGSDARVAAHLLRHCKRALEELVEEHSERAGRLRDANRLLHLTEDLRLADDHGVEAGGDAKRMPHGFTLGESVEVGLELLGLHAVVAGEPLERRIWVPGTVDLGAIAGRKNCRLPDRLVPRQFRKSGAKALGVERHALANRERSGLVVQSQRKKLHGERACVSCYYRPATLQGP